LFLGLGAAGQLDVLGHRHIHQLGELFDDEGSLVGTFVLRQNLNCFGG
jgi:hypothetical protein